MLARHSGGCVAADEISHENNLVLRVAAALAVLLMAYAPELGLQSAGMSVDVSDDVVHDLIPGRSSEVTVPTVELGCHPCMGGWKSNNSRRADGLAHPGASGGKCVVCIHALRAGP